MTKRQRHEVMADMLKSNGMRVGGTLFCHARTALELAREQHNDDLIAYLEEVCSRPNEGVVFKDGTCREITDEDKI